MNVEVLNRLTFYHQGQFTAVAFAHPSAAVAAGAAASNTAGIDCRKHAGREGVLKLVATRAGGAASVYGIAYAFSPNYRAAATPGANTAFGNGWQCLGCLNSGAAITPATDAVAGVNIIEHTANGFIWPGKIYIGSLWERLLIVPLTGSLFDTLDVYLGIQGE